MDALELFLQEGTWHMGDGWGWWMMFGWLWMVALWGLIVWAAVYIARRLSGSPETPRSRSNALDILEERYARGELTDEEFDKRRRRILESDGR